MIETVTQLHTELHSVGSDHSPGVAGQGAGLVHQVPQAVTVDDDGNSQVDDLLQHQRDPDMS